MQLLLPRAIILVWGKTDGHAYLFGPGAVEDHAPAVSFPPRISCAAGGAKHAAHEISTALYHLPLAERQSPEDAVPLISRQAERLAQVA